MLKINQRAKCPAYYKRPANQNNQTVLFVWVEGRKQGRISPPGRPIGRREILVVLINAQPQDWEWASPKTFIYNTFGRNKRFLKLIIMLIVLASASGALRETTRNKTNIVKARETANGGALGHITTSRTKEFILESVRERRNRLGVFRQRTFCYHEEKQWNLK